VQTCALPICPRRRRAVLRAHRARRPGRPERPGPAARRAAGRPGRPRPPRTAHPRRLRRQEPAHLAARDGARAAGGDRRPRRRAAGPRGRPGRPGGGPPPLRRQPRPRRREHRQRGGELMRHLLSTADLGHDEAVLILDTARELAQIGERSVKKLPTLRGRTVVNLFYEDSTRTRTSFELAAKRLSADVINFSAKGSSVAKGESLKDTALTLQAMGADGVVVRHGAS